MGKIQVFEEEEKKDNEIFTQMRQPQDENEIEEENKFSQKDLDDRLIEAFYLSLIESVADTMLPMEPSNFQKEHLNSYVEV